MRYLKRPEGIWVPIKELPSYNDKDKLPAKVFSVYHNDKTGFYLQEIEPFKLPSKLYGRTNAYTSKILSTFHKTSGQLGVFLEGRKGSGKTLLAKNIAIQSGYPCIVINQSWCSESFMAWLQSIEQPCVVLFDEFEKVYGDREQDAVLTLFDGMYSSRKIMIVTCNNKWKVGQYFLNRPGRFRYAISFGSLERDFILEYLEDHLHNQDYADDIVKISAACSDFNFDILQSLVDELNLHGGSFDDTLDILNIDISQKIIETWDITVSIKDPEDRSAKFVTTYRGELFKDIERGRDCSIYAVRKDISDKKDLYYRDGNHFGLRMDEIKFISDKRDLMIFESIDEGWYSGNPYKIEARKKESKIDASVYGSSYQFTF